MKYYITSFVFSIFHRERSSTFLSCFLFSPSLHVFTSWNVLPTVKKKIYIYTFCVINESVISVLKSNMGIWHPPKLIIFGYVFQLIMAIKALEDSRKVSSFFSIGSIGVGVQAFGKFSFVRICFFLTEELLEKLMIKDKDSLGCSCSIMKMNVLGQITSFSEPIEFMQQSKRAKIPSSCPLMSLKWQKCHLRSLPEIIPARHLISCFLPWFYCSQSINRFRNDEGLWCH